MPYSDLITQKEAAVILNRSVSAVSRAIKDGRLEYFDPKNRLLHRPGLEMRFACMTRPRIDKPQAKASESITVPSDDWSAIAAQCNQLIDFRLWGPGPWPPDRWAGLAGVIEAAKREVQGNAP